MNIPRLLINIIERRGTHTTPPRFHFDLITHIEFCFQSKQAHSQINQIFLPGHSTHQLVTASQLQCSCHCVTIISGDQSQSHPRKTRTTTTCQLVMTRNWKTEAGPEENRYVYVINGGGERCKSTTYNHGQYKRMEEKNQATMCGIQKDSHRELERNGYNNNKCGVVARLVDAMWRFFDKSDNQMSFSHFIFIINSKGLWW